MCTDRAIAWGGAPVHLIPEGRLIGRSLSPLAVKQVHKRWLKAAGLPEILSTHSFRVLVVTDLLSQNVPLEDVQYLAGHTHPRTSPWTTSLDLCLTPDPFVSSQYRGAMVIFFLWISRTSPDQAKIGS